MSLSVLNAKRANPWAAKSYNLMPTLWVANSLFDQTLWDTVGPRNSLGIYMNSILVQMGIWFGVSKFGDLQEVVILVQHKWKKIFTRSCRDLSVGTRDKLWTRHDNKTQL